MKYIIGVWLVLLIRIQSVRCDVVVTTIDGQQINMQTTELIYRGKDIFCSLNYLYYRRLLKKLKTLLLMAIIIRERR